MPQQDKWAQYEVKPDPWAKYEVKPDAPDTRAASPDNPYQGIPTDAGIRTPLTLFEQARNFMRERVERLPTTGTVIGGMFGGVPGAGLGAAIGAGIRKATESETGGGGGIPLTAQGAIDTGKEMGTRGLEGAGLELGGKVAARVVGEIVEPQIWNAIKTKATTPKVPINAADINKWMDVPAKEVMHGANPGEQLLKDGLVQESKAATKAAVQSQLSAAGKEMDAHLAKATKSGVTIDAQTPTYDGVAKAVKRIGTPRDATFQAQMNGIVDDIETRYPNLHKLTPTEAHALKVELGDSIKWSGQSYDTPANQAMISIYRDLNAAIKTAVPDIAETQTKWGNLFIANKNLAESLAEDAVGKGSGGAAPKAVTPLDRLKQLGVKYGPYVIGGALGAKGAQIYHDWNRP